MEGLFEMQKEHSGLKRVKERRKSIEILCIFFGIYTANEVSLSGEKPPKWFRRPEAPLVERTF